MKKHLVYTFAIYRNVMPVMPTISLFSSFFLPFQTFYACLIHFDSHVGMMFADNKPLVAHTHTSMNWYTRVRLPLVCSRRHPSPSLSIKFQTFDSLIYAWLIEEGSTLGINIVPIREDWRGQRQPGGVGTLDTVFVLPTHVCCLVVCLKLWWGQNI